MPRPWHEHCACVCVVWALRKRVSVCVCPKPPTAPRLPQLGIFATCARANIIKPIPGTSKHTALSSQFSSLDFSVCWLCVWVCVCEQQTQIQAAIIIRWQTVVCTHLGSRVHCDDELVEKHLHCHTFSGMNNLVLMCHHQARTSREREREWETKRTYASNGVRNIFSLGC